MEPVNTIEVIIKENLLENIIKSYIPILVTIVSIVVGYNQFKKQLNRNMYEKRLNAVYAPLYGYLVKQEVIRDLYLNNINIIDAPILTWSKRKIKSKIELKLDGPIEKVMEDKEEIIPLVDRKNFLKVLNDANKGLARPQLLILINQYEILIHLEENLDINSKKYELATNKKVEVEYKLILEIVKGYKETIKKLQLDDESQAYILSDLEA